MKKYLVLLLAVIFMIGCDSGPKETSSLSKTKNQRVATDKVAVVSNDFVDENALHDAVRANDLEVVRFLISQGIEVNKADEYGYTPLHLAVRLHNLEITKFLISNGANVNTWDNFGDTPLLDSTRNNDTEISKELICNGSKRNVADKHNMTTLNNSSKNNNKFISELLRADSVEPYCQDKLDIDIQDINLKEICGNILVGHATSLDVNIDNGSTYNETLPATIDNQQRIWCVDMEKENLEKAVYTVTAKAEDNAGNEAEATKTEDLSDGGMLAGMDESNSNAGDMVGISIDNYESSVTKKPRICGDILQGDITRVDLTLSRNGTEYGPYPARIDAKNSRWCARVTNTLENGKHDAIATGFDPSNNMTQANGEVQVYVIPGLYEALKAEFKDDFEPWRAELEKDTLTWKFKDPTMLFERGKTNLKTKFKGILDDFFPRYIKVLKEYENDINKVAVEGHSSSEHRLGKTNQEKFMLNLELSHGRANEVLEYAKGASHPMVMGNIVWILNKFYAKGMSSSVLVYNPDGSENKELSRRVEFRIETKLKN